MNWLNNKTSIKDSTFYNYNSIITGKLIPYFNKTKIISISKQQICDFIKLLKNQELSSKRIKDILLLLNRFFEDSGIHMKFDYPSLSKKSISTFNDNEIHTIESDALNTEDIKKFAILLTLFTGMRIGELCALQWKDIDLENKIIHITKNIIRTKANIKITLDLYVHITEEEKRKQINKIPLLSG